MALGRAGKVAFAEVHPRAKRDVAAEFLRRVLDKLPCQAHTVLTDNGGQFAPQPHQFLQGGHRFDRICRAYGVEHRLTTPGPDWQAFAQGVGRLSPEEFANALQRMEEFENGW